MNSDLFVALLSCIGTAAGAITGIIVSNRLSTYLTAFAYGEHHYRY